MLATGLRVYNNIPRVMSDDNKYIDTLTGDTKFGTVTVEVEPKDAQELILILSTSPGSIFLTVRNPNDRLRPALASATLEGVISGRSEYGSEYRQPANVPVAPAPASRPQPATPPRKKGPFIDL